MDRKIEVDTLMSAYFNANKEIKRSGGQRAVNLVLWTEATEKLLIKKAERSNCNG